jgi:hypothetical protein
MDNMANIRPATESDTPALLALIRERTNYRTTKPCQSLAESLS